MVSERVGGKISLKVNGMVYRSRGKFSCSLGKSEKKAVMGHSGILGYSEETKPGYIEGEIVDSQDFLFSDLDKEKDVTVTVTLANGKTICLKNAYFCNPDGLTLDTEEGAIKVRWEGTAEEIK